MSKNVYYFTEDWFSNNIPIWEDLMKHLRDKVLNVLEIGSYQGRSTVWLLENVLTHPDSRITCVDTFEGSIEHSQVQKKGVYEIFKHNVIENFGDKVIVHRDKSSHVVRNMPVGETYDIIYVDGAHLSANVMEDAVLSFPLLKIGGMMIFDDYLGGKPDERYLCINPHVGINAFLAAYEPFIEVIHSGYQIAIKKNQRL